VYERPYHEPAGQAALNADHPARLPRPADLRATLLDLLGSPNLASKEWVTSQYDRYVRGNTVLAMPADAGVLRVGEIMPGAGETRRGIALATDGNGRYARLDPYAGAQLALAESYRNVAVTGARPLAVTNCLNFGSPEDPEVMWQFAEAVRGLGDACRALGVPVTGGNVSFYNQTGSTPIHPTPVVGVLGVLDDVATRIRHGFTAPGLKVLLLGETRDEFGGSEWAYQAHGHLGGLPPVADLDAERCLANVLVTAAGRGLVEGSHDVSDGGLGIALAECAMAAGVGASVRLPVDDPFTGLFSESAGRAVVAVRPEAFEAFAELCASHGVPCYGLGTTGGDELRVEEVFTITVAELRETHRAPLPAVLG
jgi:phosphoribosylformylglycinamidine synthase